MTNLPGITEEELRDLIAQIPPRDMDSVQQVEQVLAKSTISKEAFGAIRFLLKKYAGATGQASFEEMPIKAVALCCADHGVAKESVSAYPPETTLHMVGNYLISHGSAANVFADYTGAHLCVADLGINSDKAKEIPGLIDFHIASGTNNSAQGPAMTREQAVKSLYYGYSLARQLHEQQGITLFLPGEMGISNTTASAAITAALLKESPANTTGRGTNISDQRYKHKLATVEKILAVNQPDPTDPIDVLAKVGGFELGAIAGLMLGAAASRSLTILDGFNSSAAALIALRLAPGVKDYLIPSHRAGEQGQPLILKEMDFTPLMDLNIKLGEAIGSSLVADILDASIRAYRNIQKDTAARELMGDTIEKDIIPDVAVTLTDKTFDYYTRTMPSLDKEAMERCQMRLDNLSKPIYSLGVIEQIASQLSGITSNELPGDISKTLLLVGMKREAAPDLEQAAFIHSFASQTGADSIAAYLTSERTQMDAFEFGRLQGENISLASQIMGLSLIDNDIAIIDEMADMLCDAQGNLRLQASSFMAQLPAEMQLIASAVLGAIIAATHNRTMIILGDRAVTALASYAAQLVPEIRPFLLPVEPPLYHMGVNIPGVTACMGMRLVDAAIHTVNDMKTFSEAQVAVANDGPGAGRQI
ncbi:Nicotinate-nucleotide--dimethylbenzimidazole phosphoribosyltransferase [Anaerovibrio sp. JC8]|uniref:nicotinate-nucleotide--dimethylbenzimidazole phosphoribosyltransferase n=1 Tax=Anaerovibrio sp. JC8 TaxID=1240085 RepID=UPI000A0ED03D|nr:nicotinate-nucleotide--dimethylbenzimidazole phosphoribosyltransferase [Anaerovibrio sp. JC8]ORT99244.1 Nicotinate-nucleotide--dimethylbenzimidazole phosphoribosyltransferase [Anaerovibrio sp. JC8]